MTRKGYILMLESDQHDRELSSNYFKERNIPIQFLQSSNEVLSFLDDRFNDFLPLPRLVLVSMKSIPENGLFVLQQIKTNDNYKHIPVVVLGENTQPDLIKMCYANGASTFINKPFTNTLTDIKIRAFIHYWFEVAEFADNKKLQYS
jgi:CheY-like chemotaxis protein